MLKLSFSVKSIQNPLQRHYCRGQTKLPFEQMVHMGQTVLPFDQKICFD